jgi:hypothetical protein
MRYLEEAALAGAATGLRSTSAVAALISAKAPGLPAVLVASVATLVSARLGHDLRVAAAERFVPSAVASAEDAVALTLAAASARA